MRHLLFFVSTSLALFDIVLAARNQLSTHPPLRCCVMDESPISFLNERSFWNNGLDGVIKDHLLEHQSFLGWTCSTKAPIPPPSADFNAAVSSMHDCTDLETGQIIDSPDCLCDIGIGGWFQTPSRFELVDFLPPFTYDQYVVFTHVSEATVSGKLWFFVQTFDRKAWISILALFLMFTFLKILDDRFAVPAPYDPLPETKSRLRRYGHYLTKSNLPFRLRKATQSTYTEWYSTANAIVMRMLLLSDEPVVENGHTTRQWCLNLVVAVSALFLILSYEASMTAFLVQESIEARFETAADLLKCKIDPSEMCIVRGGALETYWKRSIAIDECHDQNPPTFFDSYQSLFDAVENRRCRYSLALESVVTTAIRERYCGYFVIVGQPLANGGLSMILPKGSSLTEPMSLVTLSLMRNRTISNLEKYLTNLPSCRADVNTTLNFHKLRIFFIIAFSVGGALFLAMVFIPQRTVSKNGTRDVTITVECPEAKLESLRTVSTFSSEGGQDEGTA